MKNYSWLIIGLLFVSSFALADDQSSGCGAGYYLLKKNSLLSSFGRFLTNGTFSSTIGMTFGTSGCARHDIVQNEKMGIYYAEANLPNLTVEIAEGDGEHLRSFATVLGCSRSHFKAFSAELQAGYAEIFADENTGAQQMLKQVKSVLKKNPVLADDCLAII